MGRREKMVSTGVVVACLVFLAWYLVAHGQGGGGKGVALPGAVAAAKSAQGELTEEADAGPGAEVLPGRKEPSEKDALPEPEETPEERGPEEESAPVTVRPGGGASGRGSSAPGPGAGSAGEVPEVNGPCIQFDEDTFDFGTLYQRETVEHEFTFRNVGDGPLAITKVVSTCACAATAPSKKEVAAGESGTIKVEVRAGLLRGKLKKAVYVESNAVNEPRATLIITGEIRQEVEVEPLGFYIGRRKVGETMERTFTIRGVEAKEFSISEVTAGDPSLQVEGPVRLAGEVARYEVTIRFGPAEEAGRVNLKVVVRTDLEHTPEIAIPVYGRVVEGE